MSKSPRIVGMTFGTLRVDREGPPTARRQARVYCTCLSCGRTDLLIRRYDLTSGATRSCGEGDCRTREPRVRVRTIGHSSSTTNFAR